MHMQVQILPPALKLFKMHGTIICMPNNFYRQLGIGISSLTFGVALSIFIYAVASGIAVSIQAWLLLATSFLLMLRFWWRYNELFVQFLPSRSFWHFLFDFLVSFFGILAVLYVSNIQAWAAAGMLAMLSSAARCSLSWKDAKAVKPRLKRTLFGAIAMLVIMAVIYSLAPVVEQVLLAEAILIVVLIFVVYSSRKV